MTQHPACDLHIHSIASGHAFNTIDEIIQYAKKNGYSMIGISEHGPNMERAPHTGYFEMLYRLPHQSEMLKTLYGCEVNILDTDGTIDLPDRLIAKMDYVIAGLHKRTDYCGKDRDDHTQAIVSVIRSGKADIISHPISLNFIVDPEQIIEVALEERVILECNKSVLKEAVLHQNAEVIRYTSAFLHTAFKAGVAVLFGSDAHHISEMGITDEDMNIMQEIYGVSLSEMLNGNISELECFLKKRKQIRRDKFYEP